jgi:hypothetical protein
MAYASSSESKNVSARLSKETNLYYRLNTTKEVEQRFGMFLRITQRRLINHQYHSLKSCVGSFAPTSDELRHVTCLQVFLRNQEDCYNARMILEHTVRVTVLEIELSNEKLSFGSSGAGQVGREVVNTLFESNNAAHQVPKLQVLRIRHMSFSKAGTILPTVLTCNELRHLHLLSCSHTDRLCESLSQIKLNLQSFCDMGYGAHCEDAHTIFLKSLSCLQTLRFTGYYRATSSRHGEYPWPMITSQAPSLRCLEIDLVSRDSGTSNEPKILRSFAAFCASASNLQQLSIAGPEIERSTWSSAHGLLALLVGRGRPIYYQESVLTVSSGLHP